jgi:hypothetical protein
MIVTITSVTLTVTVTMSMTAAVTMAVTITVTANVADNLMHMFMLMFTCPCTQTPVFGLCVDARRRRIISGSGDQDVRVWSIDRYLGVRVCT